MSASKMPARIWADLNSPAWSRSLDQVNGFDSAMPYYRADIVERMAEALKECQSALAALTAPEAIETTTVATAWANCVAAEAKARSALNSYREASNVEA